MMYTSAITRTFTITNARYVTAKIAADLEVVRTYYGRPSSDEITRYAEEAAILLSKRFLDCIEYGFKRDGKVIFALKYVARSDGTLQADDRPGRVPSNMDVSGAQWYSYMTGTQSFNQLSVQEREDLELPVSRSFGPTPVTGNGYWEQSRSYSSNGEGVARSIFRPL